MSKSSIAPCIICKKKTYRKWAKKDGFVARQCQNCKMISINPRPTEDELPSFYQGYNKKRKSNQVLTKQRKQVHKIDRDWILKFVNKGKVLDVGCSEGQFLSHFDKKKWDRYGVEVENEPARIAKEKYGIPVKVGNIVNLSFNQKFELIILRGVIEHFSEPVKVLKKCTELLKSGGYLFITATPAGDSFAFDVYREKWNQFLPPFHLHFFSVDLVTQVLKKLGMGLKDFHYQYEETPYADITKDFQKIKNDIINLTAKKKKITTSNAFPGTMMTAVWKNE